MGLLPQLLLPLLPTLMLLLPKWLMLKLPLTPTPPKLPLPLTLMLDTPLLTLPTLMSPLWPSRPLKSITPSAYTKFLPPPQISRDDLTMSREIYKKNKNSTDKDFVLA